MMFDYNVSFEVNGERKFKNLVVSNIHEVINKTRNEYPEACMFRVLRKDKIETDSGSRVRILRPSNTSAH